MKFTFIADMFHEHGFVGGAEICNEHLIESLTERGHTVNKIHSFFANDTFLEELKQDTDVFIVANFVCIPLTGLQSLQDTKYFIYEHDHKYLTTRDPSVFPNYLAPDHCIINKEFYSKAYKVVGQSKRHCDIIKRNLKLDNIVQGYNFWSAQEINNLKAFVNSEKIYDAVVIEHIFKQKNTSGAIQYCKDNKLNYKVIPYKTDHREFCELLSKAKNLVFFPQVNETLSRVCIEAHCLNTALIVNNNISYLDEDWSVLRGLELIEFIEQAPKQTTSIFES
jgi:hypothetical protein